MIGSQDSRRQGSDGTRSRWRGRDYD